MEIIHLQYPHSFQKESLPETVLAIGYFDGVHYGHQEVIKKAKSIAEEQGRESAVMTFHPHPSVVLKKQTQHVEYITPIDEKMKILNEIGMDRVYLVEFNTDLAALLPQEFVDHFLIGLNVKHVVAGFDFSYGHKGRGTMETIPSHSRDEFSSTVVDKVTQDGTKISSTLIREKIQEGSAQDIQALLGRPYAIVGEVIQGDQRGRTIGFPTANIKPTDDFLLPKVGVYAVKVYHGDQAYYGMANVGFKPTFEGEAKKPTIEVNIFDYNGDLYGEELRIEWYTRIREETKFNGVDQLIDQLHEDERHIREFFGIN
ncbi:bifunctional riboflavin kinase/FAD synthetase [Pontibacillus sp. HMF3514]|uniref:bifunctional riboflavin kinase/FAD synthetase n=1 Tax=Pontibacillus sp. HMF3514 TaxID=2692425 RepID=UPI00131FBD65|nr:bifunctional riboflavin kinase/FAD synthetase [Pontibacillus sp. HMF3514]QHE52234.1 bifunctional riboflavin kinase/FAD synthetase [Pontibacillus sp. HMF3514]